MPSSALETLIKILRLEQDTGYKNTAVIGGLQSYTPNWARDAHQQAKTPAQHDLIEELSRVMERYGELDDRESRHQTIKYMLGRVTGRVAADPAFIGQPSPAAELSPAALPTPHAVQPPAQRLDEPEAEEVAEKAAYGQPDVLEAALEVIEFAPVAPAPKKPAIRAPKPRRARRKPLELDKAYEVLQRLNDPVSKIKGVGEKRAEQLARLGLYTLGDVLFFLPRRYDDYTKMAPLHRLPLYEQVTAIGTIEQIIERRAHGNRPYISVQVGDGGGKLNVTFFNQPYLMRMLKSGMQVAFYGKTDLFRGQLSMTNPDWELVDQRSLQQGSIVPVYPLTEGLSSKVMRKFVREVIDAWANQLPDYMPESVLDRVELVDLGWALRQAHFPQKWEFLEYAQERLAFDELMLLQLGVLAKRQVWQSVPGIPLAVNDDWLHYFIGGLPYSLTGAQQRAVEAIRQDLTRDVPMNRLLQGDVGSGKTVIAAIALGIALANGKQAALMAPTSILAEQHYQNVSQLLRLTPGGEAVNLQLLTGGTPEAERRAIYEGVANGSVEVVIGTHALIQEGLEFANLAVAVIDEQHRFGVEERGALRGKGVNPHVLVMTATPIPRTLALTLYADLDLTVLDEMPPGRTPIQTRLLFPNERERAYSFIKSQLDQGRQAFIIYPLVEASDTSEAGAAIEAYEDLQATAFRHYRLGLMHGRLRPSDKDEVMAAVASGEVQALISTSVIEVGIDVSNATVILIEGANRFGLAQLHQFRGRVGRGQHASYCLLVSDTEHPEVVERLKQLEDITDGFALAELDWKLRGPGDLLGTRQAGFGAVKLDQVMDVRLVEVAQQESRALFAEDPEMTLTEHTLLAQRVRQLQARRTDLS